MYSVDSLRNYLLHQPLIDWLDRYGSKWLHRKTTPTYFRELPTDGKVRVGLSLISTKIDECPPPSLQSKFYKWILAECAAKQLRAPTVLDYKQAVAYSVTQALSDVHMGSHTVYEYPHLLSNLDNLSVVPIALVSGCLASKIFGELRPSTHSTTSFSSWVAVFKPTTTNKVSGIINRSAKNTQYDALRCQIAQRSLEQLEIKDVQWDDGKQTTESTETITCVLLDPKHPDKIRIWVRNTEPLPKEWKSAVSWQRSVCDKDIAETWDPLFPGDKLELCAPLGKKIPERWRAICNALLKETEDMCLLYKLGVHSRSLAWSYGARTYHDLWSMQKALSPLKLSPLLLSMTWINHRENPERTVAPRHLTKKRHRTLIQRTQTKPWFVVDFETLQAENTPWIFMVATVFVNPNTSPPTKRVFTHRIPKLTPEAQVTLLTTWVDDMRACLAIYAANEDIDKKSSDGIRSVTPTTETDIPLTNTPILHWSSAEPSFLKRLLMQSQINGMLKTLCPATHILLTTQATQSGSGGICWCDIYTLFRQEPITIAGCFDFKLKNVVKALVSLNKLSDEHMWAVEGPQDGFTAMQNAEYGYASGDTSVFHDIIKYNEADVLVIYGILVELLWNMM